MALLACDAFKEPPNGGDVAFPPGRAPETSPPPFQGLPPAEQPPPSSSCGNRRLDSGEDCDFLAGFPIMSCAQLGLGTGEARCDFTTCRFDSSTCLPAAVGSDCPADPRRADGTACRMPGQSCALGSCEGFTCVCTAALPERGDGSDAGVDEGADEDAGVDGEGPDPAGYWQCSERSC